MTQSSQGAFQNVDAAASITKKRRREFPALVMCPRLYCSPLLCSPGVTPAEDISCATVLNRVRSPTSAKIPAEVTKAMPPNTRRTWTMAPNGVYPSAAPLSPDVLNTPGIPPSQGLTRTIPSAGWNTPVSKQEATQDKPQCNFDENSSVRAAAVSCRFFAAVFANLVLPSPAK